MAQVVTNADATTADASFRELCRRAYRFMLLARIAEEKIASLYRAGKIHGGVFLGRGQEALSAAAGLALRRGDVFAPLIRDGAGRLAFGEPLIDSVRTYLGSRLGPMRGRDGNVHRGRPLEGCLPMISHLGAMISVVNGVLFARRLKGMTGTVGLASVGDGATSTGSFHEALNQAAVEQLPLVLLVANNQYAYSTPNDRQFACLDLADKAAGYGVPCHSVDGTDPMACLRLLPSVVARAREGAGPQLIVASLLRLCGHGEHDDAGYVSAELKTSPLGRDCLRVAEEQLLQENAAVATELEAWRNDAVAEVERTIAQAQREPAPDPFQEEWRAIASTHLVEARASVDSVRAPTHVFPNA
jgi:pyruvate dehydrogenase E1 component alpha subunit/2-oxoisovalerate dehydrogenase E1 component alpha subunit